MQLQSSVMHESAMRGKARHFRRSLDFRGIQRPDRNTEQPKRIVLSNAAKVYVSSGRQSTSKRNPARGPVEIFNRVSFCSQA